MGDKYSNVNFLNEQHITFHGTIRERINDSHKSLPSLKRNEEMFTTRKPVHSILKENTETNHWFPVLINKFQSVLLFAVHMENLSDPVVELHFS